LQMNILIITYLLKFSISILNFSQQKVVY
jgi:hypothetical protein